MADELTPTRHRWMWPAGRFGVSRLFLLVLATYTAGSQIAFFLIDESGLAGVFFIPAGLTVAFLLRLERRHWWVVILAAAVAEAVMDLISGIGPAETSGYVVANAVEPVIGALVVSRLIGIVDLARRRHVAAFFFGAVLVGPAAGACLGATTSWLAGGGSFATTFGQWWLGDALGVILVGGVVLVWGSSPDRRSLGSAWGAALITGTALLTLGILNLTSMPVLFLVLIGVVVAGAQFGSRAVSVTALVVAVLIALDLAFGSGRLIPGLSDGTALIVTKLQLGVFTLAGLVVAAEAHERERATRRAVEESSRARISEAERRMEHGIAVRLQQALLPTEAPEHPGVLFAARYEAGSHGMLIGGDWYDVLSLPGGRIGLTVGDVVGHGLDASAAMGRLRTAVAALALHTNDPGTLLTYLDQFARGPDGVEFATALFAILDPATGELCFASAGHPPLLVVEPEGETRWLMDGRSAPIHRRAPPHRPAASTRLAPRSTVIAFSDGLIERRGEHIEVGLQRLERTAQELTDRSPDELCDILIERMGVEESRADDVVVLVVRYLPSSTAVGGVIRS